MMETLSNLFVAVVLSGAVLACTAALLYILLVVLAEWR